MRRVVEGFDTGEESRFAGIVETEKEDGVFFEAREQVVLITTRIWKGVEG